MSVFQSGVRVAARVLSAAAVVLVAGCASFYVDTNLHDLDASERAQVAHPQAVQLLFDFQTKGVSNSRARDLIKDTVTIAVQDSGAFASVSNDPTPNGAILQVTVNNVPLSDDAFAKGFAVGFTFGLVGATVGDGYICTADYLPGPGSAKVSHSVRDAIYTSMGATASKPDHAVKVSGIEDAVRKMAHKCVGNAIDALARDPGFGK